MARKSAIGNLWGRTDDDDALVVTVESANAPLTVTEAPGTTLTTGGISVTSSATLIVAAATTRRGLVIQNNSSDDVYIGASGVSTTTGVKLAAGASVVDNASSAAWYGIVASGTANVRYVQVTA